MVGGCPRHSGAACFGHTGKRNWKRPSKPTQPKINVGTNLNDGFSRSESPGFQGLTFRFQIIWNLMGSVGLVCEVFHPVIAKVLKGTPEKCDFFLVLHSLKLTLNHLGLVTRCNFLLGGPACWEVLLLSVVGSANLSNPGLGGWASHSDVGSWVVMTAGYL